MAKYLDNELRNKSVEELQRIKDELEQSKETTSVPPSQVVPPIGERPTPVPSQPKLLDSQLHSMSIE